MQFMILMSEDPAWYELPEAEQTAITQAHSDFESALSAQRKYISSARFRADEGQSVHQNDDGIQDISEAPEAGSGALGGYYLIECDTMEEALHWAQRCRFVTGTNTVYPLWD